MPDAFVPTFIPTFAPTLAAARARARIAAVRPAAYARSRNAIDGAVSGLSPYITHGLVTLGEVLAGVVARHALEAQHKFRRAAAARGGRACRQLAGLRALGRQSP